MLETLKQDVDRVLIELGNIGTRKLPGFHFDVNYYHHGTMLCLFGEFRISQPIDISEHISALYDMLKSEQPLFGIDFSACQYLCSCSIAVVTELMKRIMDDGLVPVFIGLDDKLHYLIDIVGLKDHYQHFSSYMEYETWQQSQGS